MEANCNCSLPRKRQVPKHDMVRNPNAELAQQRCQAIVTSPPDTNELMKAMEGGDAMGGALPCHDRNRRRTSETVRDMRQEGPWHLDRAGSGSSCARPGPTWRITSSTPRAPATVLQGVRGASVLGAAAPIPNKIDVTARCLDGFEAT